MNTDTGLLTSSLPIFVGRYDVGDPEPVHAPGYLTARLLVMKGGVPAGIVTLPLHDGRADVSEIAAVAAETPDPTDLLSGVPRDEPLPVSVTVTVGTRDRPHHLQRLLRSISHATTPCEVLIVDNASVGDATRALVESWTNVDNRLRYVFEARPGLSNARNRALQGARGDVILYIDDDVEVDSDWIRRHAMAYRDPVVDCVTGPAYAARLDKREEVLCETTIGWSKGFSPQRFDVRRPPAGAPLFPFSPGLFGGGMNFSVRRDVAVQLGGFDPELGAGRPTRGAEDCDFFVRLVRAGHILQYEPAALVFHHHRSDADAYADQRNGYTIGMGAYMAKLARDPKNWAAIARRAPHLVRRNEQQRHEQAGRVPTASRAQHLRLLARGALHYLRATGLSDRTMESAGRPR